jgi:prepilin-type N-terminal cleavage/methylation domain-containing protein
MKKQGFTLLELLVGITISLFLVSGMAVFLGNASYGFQSHKAVVKDRGELKRSLNILARDLMEAGVNADEDGKIIVDASTEFFMDYDNTGIDNTAILGYWRPMDTMDTLCSQDPTIVLNWTYVGYQLADWGDPFTGAPILILERNGDPFITGVTDFQVALGVDFDDDGVISADLGEWVTTPPADATEAEAIYGGLRKIRVTVTSETAIIDGDNINNTISQEIYLRNRGTL